jgi:predicted nucleotidyltransferase
MNPQREHRVSLTLGFPFGEEQVFRYRAMENIPQLLVRNPFRAFTVRRLRELTNSGMNSTTRAVDLLTQPDLVRVDTTGRSKGVSLNRDAVSIPGDPLFAIPQDEFRLPVREFVARARDEVPALSALVVFDSVARGEADRQSDIDLWLLVDDQEQLLQARRTATTIATELADERFPSPREDDRTVQGGDRHEFEVLVESVDTATSYDGEVAEIPTEGIVVVDSEALAGVTDAVLRGEEVTADG